ncbi:MAG: hypothetical protein AAGD06_04550 [Acidobacteriota bacterium]
MKTQDPAKTLQLDGTPDRDKSLRPILNIRCPKDGGSGPSPVPLRGNAFGPQGGGPLGHLIEWRSDRDGFLGTGTAISAPLTPFPHVITAEVTDPQGRVRSKSVSISVMGGTEPMEWICDDDDDGGDGGI